MISVQYRSNIPHDDVHTHNTYIHARNPHRNWCFHVCGVQWIVYVLCVHIKLKFPCFHPFIVDILMQRRLMIHSRKKIQQ